MFSVLILLAVGLVSLHVASYGWYAWQKDRNRRGAVGAMLVAGVTFMAPVLLMLYYAFFLN